MWHTSIRNHITDRPLTDEQWAHIAAEIMNAVGLAPHGDPNAVRWAAIRHAEDHIHLVATLVRQDGATAWAWNERYNAQAAARRLEREFGLYRVGPADHTAHRYPGAAEQNKTRRLGHRDVPRDRLRREVRAAVAAATDERSFVTALQAAGVLVRLRHSTTNPGDVTGYAVGLPHHCTAAGDTIWYGGGRLAPDLTLPRLRQRWGRPVPNRPATNRGLLENVRDALVAARQDMATWSDIDPDRAAATAVHGSDVLSALSAMAGRGQLTRASDLLDRAARAGCRDRTPYTLVGANLRSVGRLLSSVGRLRMARETRSLLEMLEMVAAFADTLAALRRAQIRLHQANAAHAAAVELRTVATRMSAQYFLQPPLPIAAGWPNIGGQPAHRRPRR
ncbi:relaxase/mobilization nuclease domain-containing protein [Virgisporangium ochraceum]|uniref:relaxase/mobilization nuclease domain-containing protein n=1 Tax=Virgisporangium ochraceum TaxID=65505 RepID=UPI001EF1E138|nr:relaxase/mobilization nuclease domain-containing protein [Virgisporangium ochraceum]